MRGAGGASMCARGTLTRLHVLDGEDAVRLQHLVERLEIGEVATAKREGGDASSPHVARCWFGTCSAQTLLEITNKPPTLQERFFFPCRLLGGIPKRTPRFQ